MGEKTKVVVYKKNPKGIVSFFGNVQNKVGTYDKEKLEGFKNKLIEKGLLVGVKILFVIDKVDEVVTTATDDFFDKVIDSYEKIKKKDEFKSMDVVDFDEQGQIDEIENFVSISSIIPVRSINFEDLEPLGQIIDEEDDISELQELKMELLFREQEDEKFKESDVIRKK